MPLLRALLMSHAQGNVDHKLKEIIRILLARFANDKYFARLRSTRARDMGLTEKRIDEGCFDTKTITRVLATPRNARYAMPT